MIKNSANKVLVKINKFALASLLVVAVSLSFGIPLTGKSMTYTAHKYMESSDALQYEFTHTLGIDQQMIDQLSSLTGFNGFGVVDSDSYMLLNGRESVVRVFSYSSTTHKDLTLLAGSYPTNTGETVIDQRLKDYHNINIGDRLEILENDVYHAHNTKVVGIVSSNLYMNLERGYSDLGMGRVEGYAYSLGIEPKSDQFTSVRFYDNFSKNTIDSIISSQKAITLERYNRIASPLLSELQIKEFKLKEAYATSNAKFDIKKRELDAIQINLQDTHSEIESALSEMGNDLNITFGAQSLQSKLEILVRLIDDKEVNEIPTLEKSISDLETNIISIQTKIIELNLQLENNIDVNLVTEIHDKIKALQLQVDSDTLAKENLEIDLISTQENIELYRNGLTRISTGIESYTSNYESYQVSFASYLKERDASTALFEKQTLELDKQRQSIEKMETGEGTLKNKEEVVVGFLELLEDSQRILNVGSFIPNLLFLVVLVNTISMLYIDSKMNNLYFIKVWIISSGLGYVIGYLLVSNIIFTLYKSMYQTPNLTYNFTLWILLKPLLFGLITTVLTSFVFHFINKVKVRPRFDIEKTRHKYVMPLFGKISNLTKLRYRNLMRSKLIVLIICIVSSILFALLSASIAYKFELSSVIDRQYSEVLKYDGLMNISSDFDQEIDDFEDSIKIGINKTVINKYLTTIYTFPSNESIKNWIDLNDVSSKNSLELIDGFVVITEKLAMAHNITIGSSIGITIEGRSVDLIVSGISENQLGHAIYMSEITYENSGLGPIDKNSMLFRFDGEIEEIVNKTLNLEGVKSVSFKDELVRSYKEMIVNYNLFILFSILITTMCILGCTLSIVMIIKSKRDKDLNVLLDCGFSMKLLLKERYLDALLYNGMSLILSIGISGPLYRYLVYATQVPELIIDTNPNYVIMICVNVVAFLIVSIFITWINRNLSIDDMK